MQYKYSIRRLKRAKYRKTFTKKCLNKWGDEFKEIPWTKQNNSKWYGID